MLRPALFCLACTLALPGPVAAEEEIIELPPFVVTGIVIGPAWRFAEIPGYEILSQCSDTETREIVAALWRGRQLALPPSFRPNFSLPMTVVLFDQPPVRPGQPATLGSVRGQAELKSHWTNVIKRTVEDRESFALNLWPGGFGYSPTFRFDLFTLLRRRAPPAPAWLNEGLFGKYGLYREGIYWNPGDEGERVHVGIWHSAAEVRQIETVIKKVQMDPSKPVEFASLLPFVPELAVILEGPPPTAAAPAATRWASAAALFVRWGIYGRGNPEEAAQFWRFAERACVEPVNEPLFRACFGQSYADVRSALARYLPTALAEQGTAPVTLAPMPMIALRTATSVEIARVRGEWERIEAAVLGPRFPDLARDYRAQAAANFERASQKGSREPRLFASMGLLALDSGNLTLASQYLEQAVAGEVAGPRPYLEAAKLRWALGLLDDTGTVAPETLAGIIDLLLAAERQEPPLESVYLLLAKAVGRTGTVSPGQAAALERGLRFFPRQPEVQQRLTAALLPAAAPRDAKGR